MRGWYILPLAMKALIKVGYGCNDHCTFCHTLEVRHIDDTSSRVDRKIHRAAQLGYSMVVLSGGEPTIRPELMHWARLCASLDLDFGLVTNGRLLSYPAVVEKLLGYRLRYVYLSLHGGSAKVHNACVRSKAFEESYGALQNLTGKGLDLGINCVITRTNLPHLKELVDACLPFEDAVLKFSATEPKGGGALLFDRIVPKVTEVGEEVARAIRYGLSKTTGLRFGHGGIPLCHLPGLEHLYDDLRTHGFASMTEVWEEDFVPIDSTNMTHPDGCAQCGLRGACPGLFKGYIDKFGPDEVHPRPAHRSNSFNYAQARILHWPKGGDCPVRSDGTTPYDPARTLFVRNDERMVLFETKTRDFSDEEIHQVKWSAGQIYLDVSRKDAPDDFAADLKKLREVDECTPCPERERCPRCFRMEDENVFLRDDARLRAVLASFTGDILDIGCGDGRYGDALAHKARSGEVRYRGVDPDPRSLDSLSAAWPWAQLEVGRAETLELEDSSWDHILLLRSYNHLSSPQLTLPRLVRALRPGGTLLLADNVAFGLIRTPRQVDRAENGPAVFEHYRNDCAAQAAPLFEGLPVVLLQSEDVGPQTSNQWFLHYQRTTDARG